MPTEYLLLVGAGGHARVVFDALRSANPSIRVSVRDDNPALEGQPFCDECIETPVLWGVNEVDGFHVAIGDNVARARCLQQGWDVIGAPRTVIHPRSIVSPRAQVAAGAFVAAGAIVAPSASVGRGVIVNHGAVVDHDCVVGDFSHIAPNATLGGDVKIGRGTLIGAGAVVLPGRVIGDQAIVAAGAVVTRDVAPGVTIAGVPARQLLS